MSTLTSSTIVAAAGGSFLLETWTPAEVFTPEDLNEEQRQIAATAARFAREEIVPAAAAIEAKEPGVLAATLRKAGDLGFTGVDIPEEYGGMGMDKISSTLITDHISVLASFSTAFGAQVGIGSLPLVWYGTEDQKRRYLPKLATAAWIAAYSLSESSSGSDAMNVRTRATLSEDGREYILTGEKMWTTNCGIADLFTVFAKVGGEKFTAFLVERNFPGVSSGAEEHKMGITGSSTTAVYFDNVAVPVENVLGEIGRGHVIAFNILNIGRLKLGPATVGAAKNVLAICLKYAKQRKAFGSSIAEFGAIQHKLAEMAIRIFAAESMTWRVVGLIENQMQASSAESAGASRHELKAIEEFAAECSMVKVYAAEMLDYVVDEGVQIHGGYGYHQDYAVERAYRDSRINRLFEGTSEINRLVITGQALKRAAKGFLPLLDAARRILETADPQPANVAGDAELSLVQNAKNIALLTLGVAYRSYGAKLEQQQEIIMNLSDITMEVLAMESSLLRSRKLRAAGRGANAADACAVYSGDAMTKVERSSTTVLSACAEGDELGHYLSRLRAYATHDPVNSIVLRRQIAARLLANERYIV